MSKVLEYPICRTHGNLALLKDERVVSFYRVPNVSITITDDVKKEEHKTKVASIIKKLVKNKFFEIALVPKDFLLDEKMSDFSETLADDTKRLGEQSLRHTVDVLTREMEIPYQYEWLIGVDLTKQLSGQKVIDLLMEQADNLATNVAKLANYDVITPDDWYERYQEEELALYQSLSSLRVRRLTDEEMFYNQRLQYLRYIPHLKKEVIANRALLNVTDTLIKPLSGGFLKLETPYGKSFVSILPMGEFPSVINGFHLGEFVQRFNFPVELRIKGEFINKDKIKGRMSRSNNRYFNIIKEAKQSNTSQINKIIQGYQAVQDLMQKMGSKASFIEFGTYLIVTGSSIRQLRQRRQKVLSYFADRDVSVHEASHDTPYLFQNLLLSQKLNIVTRKWYHITTPRGFAELMLFGATRAGNRVGHYIGRIDNRLERWDSIDEAIKGSRHLVLFNATVANKEDIDGKLTKNPHVIITGPTGVGKSYLAQLLFLTTATEDVKLLYIDPKRAIRKQYEAVIADPEFQRQYPERFKQIKGINFVTLDSSVPSNKGVLDPIVMLERADAISTAKNMLNYLISDTKDITLKQRTAINNTIKDVVNRRQAGETVGFNHVIEELCQHSDEKVVEVGEYLRSTVEDSILTLAFSDGETQGLDYGHRVTVLEVADLTLPKGEKDKSDTTVQDKERDSIVLMFALGAFCARFGERNQYEETIEILDEAWVLMDSKEGRAIIKNIRRVGRHFSNVLVLVTQSVHDAHTDEDSTGFGSIFAFKEDKEKKDILEHVGLEQTEKNLEWLDNMISGQCLYKDVYGNVNLITVHTVFKDIDRLLKPMKATVSSDLENKYAS